MTGMTTYWYYNFKQENMVYGLHQEDIQQVPVYGDYILGDHSQQEASIPRTLRTPTVPTQEEIPEIDKHNLTHLPCRDGGKHCVLQL
eukprot:119802-Amphidinium_carterae.3